MARLNEPMVAADNIETLRRKFLRQNRDIARVNSTQSLRIRSLDNECARLLSENLELRGQILRLETELQESRAQKIADHALEIKEKMEDQLLEWGEMLASLGHEPMPRSRSPRTKKAKTRPSFGRLSPPQWRRRDPMDVEAAAQREGRLPPLWENKPCPRETLTREEIMALCAEAAETAEVATESPDLGPPPVSRFVDEDPIKIDLPTKLSPEAKSTCTVEESFSKPVPKEECAPASPPTPAQAAEQEDQAVKEPIVSKNFDPNPTKLVVAPDPKPSPPPSLATAKANLKRKSMDDEDQTNPKVARPTTEASSPTKCQPEKPLTARERPSSRPMKEIPAIRRDARGKPDAPVLSAVPAQRRPLSAKNSNEVLKSPVKSAKPSIPDDAAKPKADSKREGRQKDRTKPKAKQEMPVAEIVQPEPQPVPQVVSVEIEAEVTVEPTPSLPSSPRPAPAGPEARDTPPPADISSVGETARGSRRARTSVSYAEPNLRDKMRRPTKQLFDAVDGLGTVVRRTSSSKPEIGPMSEAKSVKSGEKPDSWQVLPMADSATTEASDAPASPLGQKASRIAPTDDQPPSGITERRKRTSSMAATQGADPGTAQAMSKPTPSSTNRRLDDIAAREAEVARIFEGSADDVYAFATSPGDESPKQLATEDAKRTGGRRTSRSRKPQSALREDLTLVPGETSSKGAKTGGPKKRASMMAPKKSNMGTDGSGKDGTAEGDSMTSLSSAEGDEHVRDRPFSMRRRSMML